MSYYPSTLTQLSTPVLNILRQNFFKYQGTPFCFVETSHRSKAYDNLNNATVDIIQKYFNAEEYQVLLMASGSAMTSIHFNITQPNSKMTFYSKGSFSDMYYKQMIKYQPNTKIVNKLQDLQQILEKQEKDIRNIYHYNSIDDGQKITFPYISQQIKKDSIIIRNINYCFPSIQTQPLTEDIVYFESQTGFSVPGFTVMLIKKSFMNKLQVRKDCPDMFDFILMVKMKSVVNTPFTLCTLVLFENIRYAYENRQILINNVIKCKKFHINALLNAGLRLQNQEGNEFQQYSQGLNFIKLYFNQRQSKLVKQLQSYGWVDNESHSLILYIQSQNTKQYQIAKENILSENEF